MEDFICSLPARVDARNAAAIQEEVMAQVEQAVSSDCSRFVMDMEETGYLSSAGLRIINMSYQRIKGAGKEFTLKNVSDAIRDLLDVTGFSGYLPME